MFSPHFIFLKPNRCHNDLANRCQKSQRYQKKGKGKKNFEKGIDLCPQNNAATTDPKNESEK